MKLTKAQTGFLNRYVNGTWNLNSEGFVDVDGDFDCYEKRIKDFMGIKFGKISGNFCCSENKLTSLEGAPQEVGKYFDCHRNKLTSLVGAPQKVGGGFDCGDNQLTSLEGAPKISGDDFYCYNNKLTSLEGAPQKVGGNFSCSYNQLTSLVGAPQEVRGGFDCSNNKLTSLVGAPQKVGRKFYCKDKSFGKTFELIYEKIKGGIPYGVALLSSKSKISKAQWKRLDKSSIEGIDPEEADNIEKGGSFLSRVGIL